MPYVRYRFDLAYHGTKYCGWQRGVGSTVCGTLDAALSQLAGADNIRGLTAASRTDAGVHALQNHCHVDINKRASRHTGPETEPFAARNVELALNHFLREGGAQVAVSRVQAVPLEADGRPGFHARHSASGKVYVYTLLVPLAGPPADRAQRTTGGQNAPAALWAPDAWLLRHPLDLARMRTAASALVGTHDMAALRSAGCEASSTVSGAAGRRAVLCPEGLCALLSLLPSEARCSIPPKGIFSPSLPSSSSSTPTFPALHAGS